jgi:hypothetical protein
MKTGLREAVPNDHYSKAIELDNKVIQTVEVTWSRENMTHSKSGVVSLMELM